MPSESKSSPGLSSSSFFSEDTSLASERHIGFRKLDTMPDRHATGKSVAVLPLENFEAAGCQPAKSLEFHHSFLTRDQKLNHNLISQAVGTGIVASPSSTLLRPGHETRSGFNVKSASSFLEGGKDDMKATQYENSLFSSSLSELFSRKMRLSSNNIPYGHSVGNVATHFKEGELFESLKEIEVQTIGNLLPSDDDLFSGMTNKRESINQSNGKDDMEELDVFSSVGGLDLGDDKPAKQNDIPGAFSNVQSGFSNGSIAGQHPHDECPSRTLLVRNLNRNVEDSVLRALFERYGDVHTLYTSCIHQGFVMITYYDIRAARNAMKALQDRSMGHRKLDIHYLIPKDNPLEKDINQGTVIVFNRYYSFSNDELHQIFGMYGEIKEIHEAPHRSCYKFIEFYDVRAAEAALHALNSSDIAGTQIKLEPTHMWGSRCLSEHNERGPHAQRSPPNNSASGIPGELPRGTVISNCMDNGTILGLPYAAQAPILECQHGISSSVPNSLYSLLRVESAGNHTGIADPGRMQGQLNFDFQGTQIFHPHSVPDYHNDLKSVLLCNSPGSMASTMSPKLPERIDNRQSHRIGTNGYWIEFNDGVFGSSVNGSPSLPVHNYAWDNSYHPHSPGIIWPSSPSFVNGISMAHPTVQLHGLPREPPPLINSILPINNHHVGSAQTVKPSLWERRGYAGESFKTSGFHSDSLGSLSFPNNSLHSLELLSPTMFPHVTGNYVNLPNTPRSVGLQPHYQISASFPGRNQMMLVTNSFDSPKHGRSRRNEVNQPDNKQYELDIYRILKGEDNRTTLMIRNIPNKYTSKMLLATIDEHLKGTYDFIYLPIDFQNKCNVGYAFINMIAPSQIIPFYQMFNGKKWEKFNSLKLASLAYARIQGKVALIEHFQNSSLMNEDKRCRPMLFKTDGPNAGDQVPFPMGVNFRAITGNSITIAHEENEQGCPLNLANRDSPLNADASSWSGKESD